MDSQEVWFTNSIDVKKLQKDRLDFGFDSMYFRYAEAIDELMMYKILYDKMDPHQAKVHGTNRKMHFYNALEQLLQAHEKEEWD